jgi:hypothetical protein
MKKTVLNYGLISGLFVSAWMSFSMLVIGCDEGEGGMILGYTGMLLAFAFIFVAIKNYRDKLNGGIIDFWKGFSIGLLISLIASTFYAVTWLIVYYNFMPDFMEKFATKMIENAKASGVSAAELNETIAQATEYKEMYKNPFMVMLMTYAEIFPVGLLVSLITALILKRSNPQIKEA